MFRRRKTIVLAVLLVGVGAVGIAVLQNLQREARARSASDLFQVACTFEDAKQRDRAKEILLQIVDEFPDTATASRSMLALAQYAADAKDPAEEANWLKRCANLIATGPTSNNLMDTDNTRSYAHQRLGAWHEARGEWRDALKMWQAWQPESWCGTCMMQMRQRRDEHILRCRFHLGEHAELANETLKDYKQAMEVISKKADDPHVKYEYRLKNMSPETLLALYRGAEQEEDLDRMMSELEKSAVRAFHSKKADGLDALMAILPTTQMRNDIQAGRPAPAPNGNQPAEFDFDKLPRALKGSLPKTIP